MICKYCNLGKRFEELKIMEYDCWTVYLHSNQCYLGRCIIKLNRHLEDFFDITTEEQIEYFWIVKNLRETIKKLFGADMFNYAIHGNVVKHLHLHFVPRYSEPSEVSGFEFKDERWGKNYVPYDKEFKTPRKILLSIKESIEMVI